VQNNSTSQNSPDSPPSSDPNAFPLGASFLALCGLVLFYVASLYVLLHGFGVTRQSVRSAQLTPALVAAQVLGYVPVIAYLFAVLPILAKRRLTDILGPFGTREAWAGLAGAVMMWFAVVIVGAIQTAFLHHAPTQLAVRLFESARPGILLDLMIFVAIVLAPFTEELVFRAFIFNALRSRMPLRAAAAVSGLIFGAAHGEYVGILPLAAGGIVLAAVYARTGSLLSSVIAHGTFNGFTLILLFAAGIKT
jgi:membrane protease YdiL (CAAX protease family)